MTAEGTDGAEDQPPPTVTPATTEGSNLVADALAHRGAGRSREAAEVAGRAVSAFLRADQALPAARAQRLAADCLADGDHHADALGLLKRARRTFVAADPTGPDVAAAEVAAARSLRALGRLSEARRALVRAEAGFRAAAMPVRVAICHVDRAVLLHDGGSVAEAVALLDEARSTFLHHRRPDLAAVGDFDLGVALLDDGRAEDAIERFFGARVIFSSLERRADQAACDLNMGVALHAVGRSDEAGHALRRARAAFRELGRERDAEQAEHDLDVLDGLVDPDTAEMSVLRDLGEVPPAMAQMAVHLDEGPGSAHSAVGGGEPVTVFDDEAVPDGEAVDAPDEAAGEIDEIDEVDEVDGAEDHEPVEDAAEESSEAGRP